jgi:enamine deaminase RidA (YjgF/YER057c/UK114 family)
MNKEEILDVIADLGLPVDSTPKPGGSYVSVNVRGSIAYVAIQFPIVGEEYKYLGRFGDTLATQQGYEAAKLTAGNIILQIEKYVGLEDIEGLNHLDIYYQAANGWDEGPKVANGASDLFVELLREKGRHTRAIFGVDALPRNFSVGITASFTLANQR